MKFLVGVQSDADEFCTRRTRQYNRVAGCRSTSGVNDVAPPEPSGMSVRWMATVKLPVDDAEKSLLSEIWNSYSFVAL